jgi:hypothetical protein
VGKVSLNEIEQSDHGFGDVQRCTEPLQGHGGIRRCRTALFLELRCHVYSPINDSRSPWTNSRGPVTRNGAAPVLSGDQAGAGMARSLKGASAAIAAAALFRTTA